MLEKLVGLDKVSILQCEELAKTFGYNSMEFDLCGPEGMEGAKWLDAYMGLFQLDGLDGFSVTRQFAFVENLWCENLRVPDKSQ